MAALTGNKIKDSYLGLLKSIDNAPFSPRASGTFVQISDGGGNSLPLYLSTTSINFYNAYTFPSADGTISGQVLSTDANGTLSWVTSSDNQTLEEVLTQGNTTTIAISSSADITTTAQFNGDINGALLQKVKAAEVLSKGDVVYISGGTGDNPEVSKANASDSTKMPALGIMKESLNNINDEGECITSGELTGVNLTGFSTGDELFVSSTTAGGLVDTAPTGEANLIQKIGKVIKGGNGGALTVLGAFRTNAMPNLPTGIILGDTTNVVTAITDGSVGQILSTDGNGTYSFIDDNAITSAVSPLNLSANQISLGTVGVSKGGTGAITLTGILLGDGTSAISGITSADDGYVLTADGNGGYAFEVASGDVSISGTPTANQIAIWTDGSTIKGMSALEISTDGTITLSQPNSDDPIVVTNSYNIGGGNIANVTGYNNTGFGNRSLFNVTTGSNNVGLGSLSMQNLTTASSNTAIGNSSMSNDTITGSNNVAIGDQSLLNLQSGSSNVAIGVATMANNDMTGTANVAIGYQSLQDVSSGGSNVAIGYQSLKTNQNQSNNVAIGSSSMLNNTGNKNIAIGTNTLYASGFNISNVAIGHESLKDVTTGSRNTAIGYHSGTDNITGLDNTFIGYQSGYQMTSGNNNVIIGAFGGSTINGSSNNIIISDGDGNNRIQVNSGGDVGIGTAAGQKLVVGGGTNGRVRIKVDEDTNNFGKFDFSTSDSATSSATMIAEITANITDSNPNSLKSELSFSTNSGDSLNTALTISSGGAVRINNSLNIGSADESNYPLQVRTGTDQILRVIDNVDGNGLQIAAGTDPNFAAYTKFQLGNGWLKFSSTGNATFSADTLFQGDLYPVKNDGFIYFGSNSVARIQHISSSNSLAINTNGGDVGIGTSPANGRLEIKTASAIAYTPTLYIDNTSIRLTTGGAAADDVTTGISMAVGGDAEAYIGVVQNSSGKGDIVFQSHVTGGTYSEKMRIPSGGGVTIAGQMYSTSVKVNDLGSGSVFSNGAGILTNTDPSDSRLKTNIENIDYGLSEILKLRSIKFNWLGGDKNSKKQFGFIAQEVKEIIPESVSEFDYYGDKRFGLEKNAIYVGLVKAIQEQQTIIEDLKSRIEKLEL